MGVGRETTAAAAVERIVTQAYSMGVGRETTAPLLRARLDLSAYLIWIDIRISSASTMLDISAASLRRVAWWN